MTTVRVLTPPGRAAIAVVAVEGADAVSLVDRWFAAANRKTLDDQPLDKISFGRWRTNQEGQPDEQAPGEELVVVRTAADRVEVHCHGGVAASAAVVRSLVAVGATEQPASPQALAQASTERVAGVLLDQLNGALEQAVGSILGAIVKGRSDEAKAALGVLLGHERLGRHLLVPWRVVLAGPPNVGKSSLINALVGYERAIVFDQPGTTRDVVTASTAIDGWPVTLADTAGVRETNDTLEAAGVELARQTLARAEVVILVGEAAGYAAPDRLAEREQLRSELPASAAVIEVASKVDLADSASLPGGVLTTNAPAGEGITELLAAIEAAFGIECPAVGTAVPHTDEQFEALHTAESALERGDDQAAGAALQSLLAGAKA